MRLFLLVLINTLLFAQTPKVYTKLGDLIYKNASKIKTMQDINEFRRYTLRIDTYLKEVERLKEYGYQVELNTKGYDKEIYLEGLRKIEETNNFFVREIHSTFDMALKENNIELFNTLLEANMVEEQKYEDEIISFYMKNKESAFKSTYIDNVLQEREAKQKEAQRLKAVRAIQKESELSRIERIRKRDKEKEEALQKALDKELEEKKAKILEEQMRELSR